MMVHPVIPVVQVRKVIRGQADVMVPKVKRAQLDHQEVNSSATDNLDLSDPRDDLVSLVHLETMDNPVCQAQWDLPDKKVVMVCPVLPVVKDPKATTVRKVTVVYLVHRVVPASEVFLDYGVQKVNPDNPVDLVTASKANQDETETPDYPAYLDVKVKMVCPELEVPLAIQ